MELKKIDMLLYKALYLVVFGIVITQTLVMENITSMLFLMTFPLTVFIWIRSVRKTVSQNDLLVLGAIVLAATNVLLNAGLTNTALDFSYLKKLIMFSMTLLFFQAAYRFRANEELTRFINGIVDMLSVFLIVMYFWQTSQMHMLNNRVTVYLTFRFTNPNLTALFITCLFMLKIYRLFSPAKWYIKICHTVEALLLGWFVVETQSRNSLLILLVFTAVSGILIFRSKRSLLIGKGWACAIVLAPAVFLVAYMTLITSQWVQELFSFIVDVGKGLDSRMDIWGPGITALAQSPIIGAYSQISHGKGNAQMHNTHLDIAASYGIVVLILVCILLVKYLHQRGRRYANKAEYIYILGFGCATLLGIGEAAVFSGGLAIYVFAGAFLLLSGTNSQDV